MLAYFENIWNVFKKLGNRPHVIYAIFGKLLGKVRSSPHTKHVYELENLHSSTPTRYKE